MKWYTTSINVDVDTGEIITKHNRDNNYIIINKIKETNKNEKFGNITITNRCRKRAKQGKLEFRGTHRKGKD